MKYELLSLPQFDKWFTKLKDSSLKVKILARLARVENGNFGGFKKLSSNLFELRLFFGSGLRIYYTMPTGRVVLLMAGGDKSTQSKDIEKAIKVLNEME